MNDMMVCIVVVLKMEASVPQCGAHSTGGVTEPKVTSSVLS